MKTLFCILLAANIAACTGETVDNGKTEAPNNPAQAAKSTSAISARAHAEGILAGKVKPIDNDATMAWLDSLQSAEQSTRDYAFKVYKKISLQSDGALGEALCGHIKDYFAAYPKEALVNFGKLNKVEKRQTVENIAFEFSMGGKAYKAFIDEYFNGMENKCQDCGEEIKERLTGLRKSVETETKQMLTE